MCMPIYPLEKYYKEMALAISNLATNLKFVGPAY